MPQIAPWHLLLISLFCAHGVRGFHPDQVDEFQCVLCGPYTYCLNGEEFGCPSNSLSDPQQDPSHISDCVCKPGYNRTGDVCAVGSPPFYYVDGQQRSCLDTHKETTQQLASAETDCVCIPGFYGSEGVWHALCVKCGHGTYTGAHNTTECASCPDNSHHLLTGQTLVGSCECNAGYTGPNGNPCTACEGGYYKGSTGSEACQQCDEDEYSDGTGAQVCQTCDPNSAAQAGSVVDTDCECNAGYTADSGSVSHACIECTEGTAKNETSNDACDSCTAGFYADVSGLVNCKACGSNAQSTPPTLPTACVCSPGYYLDAGGDTVQADQCVACPAGKYKPDAGHDFDKCLECPDNMVSDAGSDDRLDCRCKPGYVEGDGFDGVCVQCEAGKYKDFVGSDPDAPSVCENCPTNTNSPAGSSAVEACVCVAGHEGETAGEACTPCQLGFAKALPGNALCTQCPANQFQNATGSLQCHDCPDFATSDPGSDAMIDCVCPAGSASVGPDNDFECSACPPGTVVNATTKLCSDCEPGSYTTTSGALECIACLPNSDTHEYPRTGCQCNLGHRCTAQTDSCNDGDCTPCDAHTYKNSTGPAAACDACQSFSISDAGSLSHLACRCIPGYETEIDDSVPNTCVACSGGEYADEYNMSACLACEDTMAHSYTPSEHFPYDDFTACVHCTLCAVGSFFQTEGACGGVDGTQDITCQTCLDAGLVTGPAASTKPATYTEPNFGVDSCLCSPGFSVGNTGNQDVSTFETDGIDGERRLCTACDAGFFREGLGIESCVSCAALMTTTQEGTTSGLDCVCVAGAENTSTTCEACPQDSFKASVGNDTVCVGCWPNSHTEEAVQQTTCVCEGGHFFPSAMNVLLQNGLHDSLSCQACTPGKFKPSGTLEGSCDICGEDTYSLGAAAACTPCPQFSSTLGLTEQSECVCEEGYQIYFYESVVQDELISECRRCEPGLFQPGTGGDCQACQAFCPENQRVKTECNNTHNMECFDCQANSNKAPNLLEGGPCACNAGYELDGEECVQCAAGKFKATDSDNSVLCAECEAGTFTPLAGQTACGTCDARCLPPWQTGGVRQYVTAECQSDTNITCGDCSICAAGKYANPICGPDHGNNRLDTVCVECSEGSYCKNQEIFPCPTNSFSEAGSSDPFCTCDDGYYKKPDGSCIPCGFDAYCFDDARHECPAHSFTESATSSHRLDCHCAASYYRFPIDDDENFTCAVCTPNDYCFNNSLIVCPDERMRTHEAAGSLQQCRCKSGFYNSEDNSECLECPRDHYCQMGFAFDCNHDRWTQNTTGTADAHECVCLPGTHGVAATHNVQIHETDTNYFRNFPPCQDCDIRTYCPGTDNSFEDCPSNSTTLSTGAALREDCLCERGMQTALDGDGLHACEQCPAGSFKENTGSSPCDSCTPCYAVADGVYTHEACSIYADTVCQPCQACHEGQTYLKEPCYDHKNAVCDDCLQCDFSTEFTRSPCSVVANTVCNPITKSTCTLFDLGQGSLDEAVGYYRGGHSTTHDSSCQPCQTHGTPYFGQYLHHFTSAGQTYDDPYSCQIECVGISRLVDPANLSLGCESCEHGNVLLRNFNTNGNACSFECKPGYVFSDVINDCVTETFDMDVQLELNIVNYQRYFSADDSESGWEFTIFHSNHSTFAIVVGSSAPASCHTNRGCCWQDHWRVSTLAQLGAAGATDLCSQSSALDSTQLDYHRLSFRIPDSRLQEVAACGENDSGATVCSLAVAIIDTVRFNVLSSAVSITTDRSSALVHAGHLHRYLAIDSIAVHVVPLMKFEDETFIVSFTTSLQAGPTPLNITFRVRGMNPYTLSDSQIASCNRFSVQGVAGTSVQLAAYEETSFTSVWQGASDIVHGFYAVTLLDSATLLPTQVSMDMAAVRNVSGLPLMCQDPEKRTADFEGGQVFGVSGLGSRVVSQGLVRLRNETTPLATTHGQLGTLLTFVARANTGGPSSVTPQTLLAVYAKDNTVGTYLQSTNAVRLHSGVLDFTNPFRSWCNLSPQCVYEYLNNNAVYDSVYEVRDCSEAGQATAKAWIKSRMGVVDDLGHVAALCANLATSQNAHVGVLVHTMGYLDKSDRDWRFIDTTTHTFVWAKFHFT